MRKKIGKAIKWLSILLVVVAVGFFGIRVYVAQQGPPLSRWHTYVPHEMKATELDAADWDRYLAEEARIFAAVRTEVTDKLEPQERLPLNRFFSGSPVYPGHFAQDFNRSFVLEPNGPPIGAVVLLHGLTDAPYSQRHIAQAYRDHGFVAIVPRIPGHGTVPAGLTDITWEDWSAATRLAVREARRRIPPGAPVHLVGFSNGGALALKYALDAIADPQRAPAGPHRSGLADDRHHPVRAVRRAGEPAGRAAGLRQGGLARHRAGIQSVQVQLIPGQWRGSVLSADPGAAAGDRAIQPQRTSSPDLPPIITFQSVMDFTVSTSAIVSALYDRLPENGSELVLFDVNRTVKFGALLRPSADTKLAQLLPRRPRNYRTTIITNADVPSGEEVERVIEAGRHGRT